VTAVTARNISNKQYDAAADRWRTQELEIRIMRITTLAIATMLAIGTNAHAQDARYNQERIDASRYDLSKPADARALLSRIEGAALNVCGASPGTNYEVVWATRDSPCYRDAVRMAVESAHSPTLTVAYEKHGGGQPSSVAMAAR
jgi:UrcA family protein